MNAGLKMMTGLVARLGLGIPLQLLVFCGMFWAAWRWIASGSAEGLFAWANHLSHPFGVVAIVAGIIMVIIGVIVAFVGAEENKWGLFGMLRRAPFVLWCGLTDDNKSADVWMFVFWPIIAIAELIVSLLLIVAVLVVSAFKLLSLNMWGGSDADRPSDN